jgi:hypothetical protein
MSIQPTPTPRPTGAPTAVPSPTALPNPVATPSPLQTYQTVNANPCAINLGITNNQSLPTNGPFHLQLVQLDHTTISGYCPIANTIGVTNLALYTYFIDGITSTIANSWYERFDGTYHYWWVRLSTSINANTTYPLQLVIMNYPVINGTSIGASPWWTTNAYGWTPLVGFDNGQNVFHYYYHYLNPNSQVNWYGGVYRGGYGGWVDMYNTVSGYMLIGNNYYEGKYILTRKPYPTPFPIEVLVGWWYSGSADALSISYAGNPSSITCIYCPNPSCYGCGAGVPAMSYSASVQYEFWGGRCNAPFGNPLVLMAPIGNGSTICAVSGQFFPAGTYYVISRFEFTGTSLAASYTTSIIGGIPTAPIPSIWNTMAFVTSVIANVTTQWGATLLIGGGTGGARAFIYIDWAVAFDYPPAGQMPLVTTISSVTY